MCRRQPPAIYYPGIDSHDHKLASEMSGDLSYQIRIPQSGAIDTDLVGPGLQKPRGISQRGYSSSDSEGYVQPHRDGPDQLGESPPPLQGGADVKVNKLISSLRGIFSAQFHRITNLLEP